MATAATNSPTGNLQIDRVLSGYSWTGTVTYSLPTERYGDALSTHYSFAPVTHSEQVSAITWTLNQIETFTNIDLQDAGTSTSADIRFGNSSVADPTSYAYYPSNDAD